MIYHLYKLFFGAQPRWLMPVLLLTFSHWALATPPQAPAGTPIKLPELPTQHERFPDLWDENGCEINRDPLPPGIPPCQAPLPMPPNTLERQLRVLTPEELNRNKNLPGFKGPYYTPLPTANAVVMLSETITTSATPDGGFSAVGLVRNEMAMQLISAATITGELIGASGQVISKATTEALVVPIRPGEPAPFHLTSPVSFKDVADVRWRVEWSVEPNKAKASYRDVEVTMWGKPRPWGSRDKLDLTEWDTKSRPPFPYLEVGTVENLSGVDIPNPEMIVAWYVEPKGSSNAVRRIL